MKKLSMLIPLVPLFVIALFGFMYAFMPHSFHVRYMIDFGLPHTAHMIIGIAMMIIAVMMAASILGIIGISLWGKKGGRR